MAITTISFRIFNHYVSPLSTPAISHVATCTIYCSYALFSGSTVFNTQPHTVTSMLVRVHVPTW